GGDEDTQKEAAKVKEAISEARKRADKAREIATAAWELVRSSAENLHWRAPGFPQSERHPVACVSWNDAKAYLEWLSQMSQKTYRLLSEAEREYVTRAGTSDPFWWGSKIDTSQGNYDGTRPYNDGPEGDMRGGTVPVDHFSVNPW